MKYTKDWHQRKLHNRCDQNIRNANTQIRIRDTKVDPKRTPSN